MVEPEPVKKLSKKDQISLDEKIAFKIQVEEEEEEEMISREKDQRIEEVNIDWDDVQAKIDVDYELAQRLQVEEQEELTDAEKEKLFMEFLEKRKKFFAAKRAEEKRNRPPTKAQQISLMCTYLKNMDGWKPRSLNNETFVEIQKLFNKVIKRINNFVDFKTKVVEESLKKAEVEIPQEGSSKRARDKLEQENAKKQKVENDKESKEFKKCLEIIPDDGDDITIDATPLSSNKMLKSFDKKDLEVLWRLVKTRFEKIQPVDHMDSFLLQNLKTIFEHHVKILYGRINKDWLK
nr:hypothetical protein [Tanacetum cinerariifolium]